MSTTVFLMVHTNVAEICLSLFIIRCDHKCIWLQARMHTSLDYQRQKLRKPEENAIKLWADPLEILAEKWNIVQTWWSIQIWNERLLLMRSWFQVWSENHPELWYWDKQKVNFCWILLLKFRIHSVLGLNQVFTYFSKNFIWCYLWKSKTPKSNNEYKSCNVSDPCSHANTCCLFTETLLPVHKVQSRLQHSWQKH